MENLSHIGVIKDVLGRHGFTFSKGLGQNFLVNPAVCPRIAEEGGAAPGVGVLEIGTGVGVLTHELARRADRVLAVEIDGRLLPVLEETLREHDNVTVLNADVMELDLHRVLREHFGGMPVVVCANLPYYITSPLVMRLLEQRLPIQSVTVMVQKEAAVRLCAPLGTRDAGAVTAAVRYYAEPSVLFHVSRGSFMPSPNVDSSVIRLDIREETPSGVTDEAFFFQMVRGAFGQRRKTLANGVTSAFSCEKALVLQALEKARLGSAVRPEQLTMEDFIRLASVLKPLLT